MSAGVIDQFELIEIDVHERVRSVRLVGLGQHAAQAEFELGAVDQPSQGIVRCAEIHLARQATLLGDVVEHQHYAQHRATIIENRRCGILNRVLFASARNQHRMIGQTDDLALRHAHCDRVGGNLPIRLMDDMEYLRQKPTLRFGFQPTRHALGDRVQPYHSTLGIGRDHRVTNRLQRDL